MNYLKTEDDLIYNFIIENEIASEEALQLLGNVAGFSVENMNAVIYCNTGMHDIEQAWECARDEFCFNDEIVKYYDLEEA